MKKFISSLLLILAPVVLSGAAFAQSVISVSDNFSIQIDATVPANYNTHSIISAHPNTEGFKLDDATSQKIKDIFIIVAINSNATDMTKELLLVNSVYGAINADTSIDHSIIDTWVPSDYQISEQMREKAIDANSLVIRFEEINVHTKAKESEQSFMPNDSLRLKFALPAQSDTGKYLSALDLENAGTLFGNSYKKPTALPSVAIEKFPETEINLDLNPSEPKFIKTPYEFRKADTIRAHTNINGIDFVGPAILPAKGSGENPLSAKQKKMAAAYGLIGQILASRIFYIEGSWDERTNLQIPESSAFFSRRSGDASTSGSFLGQETDLIDYTGTSEEGTFQFRTIVEKLINFLKRIMIPIAVILIAYSGIELFLSFQNEERMKTKIGQLTGTMIGFLTMMLAVNLVDWVVFGSEGQILRGEVDVAEFARRGFTEISGLFDLFTGFAVIIAVAFIVFNSITLILAGGEDEGEISAIKKRIIYSLIGIILMVSVKPIIEVFTSDGQLVIPEVRGTVAIIARWLNFILGFIGIFAVISIIYAGIQMIIHFGDDSQVESAKKIITSAAVGLILALSSWVVVYYFVFAGQV